MPEVVEPYGTHAGLDEYQGEAIWAAHTGGQDPIAQQQADRRAYWRTFRDAMHAWCDDRLQSTNIAPESCADLHPRSPACCGDRV